MKWKCFQVGKLYQNNKLHWLVSSSRENAHFSPDRVQSLRTVNSTILQYWNKRLGYDLSIFYPKTFFCVLEQERDILKVLTPEGELGWIRLLAKTEGDIIEASLPKEK